MRSQLSASPSNKTLSPSLHAVPHVSLSVKQNTLSLSSCGPTCQPLRQTKHSSLLSPLHLPLAMNSLLRPNPLFPSSPSLSKPSRSRTSLRFPVNSALDAKLSSAVNLESFNNNNPAVSTSYRPSDIAVPNKTVLDAQGRVCTGPEQTRPLDESQAFDVLDTIVRSVRGELKEGEEPVSQAQLGAFFAGMTIRANSFPEKTQWSSGELSAMQAHWPALLHSLSPELIFLADPEGTIMGGTGSGPHFSGKSPSEMRLVGALREVLAGGHLGYEEVQGVLRDVLMVGKRGEEKRNVKEALMAAFLIGQRMNRETDRELKAYCLAFDDELGEVPVADVRSLTHYGEPYDGNTRFFKSTLFVAAVRACYSESSLLHGVQWMSPKGGITEGQLLKFMGANMHLSPNQAKILLEDENVGFAYVNLQQARPSLYSLIEMREHIKKRPPLATSEKVQQFVRARGKEAIIAGFYHSGYEDPLLMLMKRRSVHSGLVIKGEEGAVSMTTKAKSVHASKGNPVNYCSGFRTPSSVFSSEIDGISRENFNLVVNAQDYGFESTETPRTDRSVSKNIELGLAALGGEKGPAYDRIVLNAGIIDHLLDCGGAEDVTSALDRAREAIDSGEALKRLMNFIRISHKV